MAMRTSTLLCLLCLCVLAANGVDARRQLLSGSSNTAGCEKFDKPASFGKTWETLTDLEKNGARLLGSNQRNYDTGHPPVRTWTAPWKDLTVIEQHGAELLGYCMLNWDGCKADTIPYSEHKKWSLLSGYEMEGAKMLGYTKNTWSTGSVPSDSKTWSQMTYAEKKNWTVLGWCNLSWNSSP